MISTVIVYLMSPIWTSNGVQAMNALLGGMTKEILKIFGN